MGPANYNKQTVLKVVKKNILKDGKWFLNISCHSYFSPDSYDTKDSTCNTLLHKIINQHFAFSVPSWGQFCWPAHLRAGSGLRFLDPIKLQKAWTRFKHVYWPLWVLTPNLKQIMWSQNCIRGLDMASDSSTDFKCKYVRRLQPEMLTKMWTQLKHIMDVQGFWS